MPIWGLKLIAVLVIFGLLTWGFLSYRQSLIDQGYNACMDAVAVAKAKADEQTRERQKEIRKESQKKKAKINDQNDDRPVGPLLNRYFDGLRADN